MPSARAIRAGKAVIELGMPTAEVEKAMHKLAARAKTIGSQFKMVGKLGMAAGGAIAAAFVPTIKAASNLEETMNKFNVVFGESSKEVKAWSDDFAKEIGRSKRQIADFMAGTQDLFVPLGFAADAATEMSKEITRLALDLASFNNMADDAVLRDLHAALTGSGEVMKKYGVIVSEAAVKQQLLNQGMDPKVATDQQKVMARLSIIMAGTTAAQGDAQRSAGAFANQMKALQGRIEDAAGAIGQALLPSVTKFVNNLVELTTQIAGWIEKNNEAVESLAKLGLALAATGLALYSIGTAFTVASVAARAFTVALAFATAHPVIAAITAVGVAIGILSLNLSGSTDSAKALGAALNAIGAVDSPVVKLIGKIGDVIGWFHQMFLNMQAGFTRMLADAVTFSQKITKAFRRMADDPILKMIFGEKGKTAEGFDQFEEQLRVELDRKATELENKANENFLAKTFSERLNAALVNNGGAAAAGADAAGGAAGAGGPAAAQASNLQLLKGLAAGPADALINTAKNAGDAIVDGFKFGTTLLDATLIRGHQKGALKWAQMVEQWADEAVNKAAEAAEGAVTSSAVGFSEAIFDTRFAAQQFGGSGDPHLKEQKRTNKILENIERKDGGVLFA